MQGEMEVRYENHTGIVLLTLVTGSLVLSQKYDEAARKLWDTALSVPLKCHK